MYKCIAILLLVTPYAFQKEVEQDDSTWKITLNFDNIIDKSTYGVYGFFNDQKRAMENIISTSYDEAVKMKESLNDYVEYQKQDITNEINNYVKAVKESSRQITDSISFVPGDGTIAKEELLENPDVVLVVPSIIQRHGYPSETHTITSKGYILNIHRIPRSKNGNTTPAKTVLLHHGLFASSADWILNGPEKALAYVLADAGYDVWMANIRGNRYSREHTSLKTDSKAYWNFSWHDVALHDVPAIIDYIKKVKGSETKIAYIGHSMGTTILFTMLSIRPEYNNELVAGLALAPVVFMSDVQSPVKSLTPIASNVAYMEMLYGSHEFIPKNSALGGITKSCNVDNIDGQLCKLVVFSICGYNERQFNRTLLPVFLSHLGTGTSWKTAIHFAQEMEAGGRFQQFDYGSYYNNRVYESNTPPEYDLSKVTLPIKLFWSTNDLLSSEKDVTTLYNRLPIGTEMYRISDPYFSHADYLWAVEAPRLLNHKVLETLRKAFDQN